MLKNKKVFEVKRVYRSILSKWKQSESQDEINQLNLKIKRLFHCKVRWILKTHRRGIHRYQNMVCAHNNQISKFKKYFTEVQVSWESLTICTVFYISKGQNNAKKIRKHAICFTESTHISDTKKVGQSSFQANPEHFQKVDDH